MREAAVSVDRASERFGHLGFSRAGVVPSKFLGRARAGTRATTPAQARHDWRAGLVQAHFATCRIVPMTG